MGWEGNASELYLKNCTIKVDFYKEIEENMITGVFFQAKITFDLGL